MPPLVRLFVLLVTLAVAAPATATVTSSSITTPADPTFFFPNMTTGAPVTNVTVNGTTNGTTGDQVDLRCYAGSGSGHVVTGINVAANGSFSYTGPILNPLHDTVCRLRAIPANSLPVAPPDGDPSDDTFKGPIIAASSFDLPPGGDSYDSNHGGFHAFDSQLTGLLEVISAGGCGLYNSNVLNPVTLAQSNSFFYCNGGFFAQTGGGSANRPYLKVDGTPAYAPTALPQGAFGTVTATNTMTFDPANGKLTVEEVDPINFCSPDPGVFPATPSSCTSATPSGVQLSRTTVFDHSGRVARVTDHWSSTDGHEHPLDALYDQEFDSSNSDNSFQFEGSGSYQRFATGAVAPTPTASPGSFFVKGSDAAADGNELDARGAVTYNDAPDAIVFLQGSTVASPNHWTDFVMHYARTVPATGSSTLQFQYANAFLLSEVQGYVSEAESSFTPTPKPPAPEPTPEPTPTPITNPIVPPAVTSTPPALPTFAASGSASTKAVGKTVVVSTGQLVKCPTGGQPCSAGVTATAVVPARLARAKTKKLVIGRAKFTVPAGQSKKLTFKLNKKGALALRKLKKLAVKLALTVRVGTGTPVTLNKTIRIKAPAVRKKRR